MKKQIVLLILVFTGMNKVQADICAGQQYSEQEFSAMNSLVLICEIPIKNRVIQILGVPTAKTKKFDSKKLFVLKDKKNNFLDSYGVKYPTDNTHIGPDCILSNAVCFSIKIQKYPVFQFLYANEHSIQLQLFFRENWVARAILVNDYILYSTEFYDDTTIRVNVNTGERFLYSGYFPNVDIYPVIDENLGFFEYQNKTYIITDSKILLTEKKYQKKSQKSI